MAKRKGCCVIGSAGGVAKVARMFHAISKRIRMEGFLLGDHDDLKADFDRDIAAWLADGSVSAFNTVSEGLETAPQAFRNLITGGNTGKMLVRL